MTRVQAKITQYRERPNFLLEKYSLPAGQPAHSPVRNDPVDEKGLEVIVADGAATAVELLEPVEDGFGQCHDSASETE